MEESSARGAVERREERRRKVLNAERAEEAEDIEEEPASCRRYRKPRVPLGLAWDKFRGELQGHRRRHQAAKKLA